MNRSKILIVVGVIFGFFSAGAVEATTRPVKRDILQKHRIKQGLHSGEITRVEAKKLRKHRRHMKRRVRRMAQDGLQRGERRKIRRMQNRMSRKIYRAKHNQRSRW